MHLNVYVHGYCIVTHVCVHGISVKQKQSQKVADVKGGAFSQVRPRLGEPGESGWSHGVPAAFSSSYRAGKVYLEMET